MAHRRLTLRDKRRTVAGLACGRSEAVRFRLEPTDVGVILVPPYALRVGSDFLEGLFEKQVLHFGKERFLEVWSLERENGEVTGRVPLERAVDAIVRREARREARRREAEDHERQNTPVSGLEVRLGGQTYHFRPSGDDQTHLLRDSDCLATLSVRFSVVLALPYSVLSEMVTLFLATPPSFFSTYHIGDQP